MQHRSTPALHTLTLAVLLAAPAFACDKSGDTKAPADGAATPSVTSRETAPAAATSEDPDAVDDSVADAMTPSEQDEALRAESEANRASDEDSEFDEYDDEADEEDFEEDYEDGGA